MKRTVYVAMVLAVAAAAATASTVIWHGSWGAGDLGRTALVMGLAVAAAAQPMKLSPQAQATLVGAPFFVGVLVLAPGQAIACGAVASVAPDLWRKRKPIVTAFNLGMTVSAIAIAATVFHGLGGTPFDVTDFSAAHLGHSAAAGATLFAVNAALTIGIVWIQKGNGFWSVWRKTWALDAVQEAGALTIGLVGATLLVQTWWATLFLVAPMALAHIALGRSVRESKTNVELVKTLERQMAELKAAQDQLVQKEKLASLGTLAAGVAHEINNPLFCIAGTAELILKSPERHLASATAVEYVRGIHEMANRASDIAGSLLRYARPQSPPQPVQLPVVMDIAIERLSPQLAEKGIHVQRDYGTTYPVKGVPAHLEQVFVNLLQNARDALASGGIITLGCHQVNGHIEAVVRDDGAGIPAQQLRRLFEPFYTTKEVGKGTGLGLFICHRIVTEHGGSIRIDSAEGQGTTVCIEIPAITSGQQAAPPSHQNGKNGHTPAREPALSGSGR